MERLRNAGMKTSREFSVIWDHQRLLKGKDLQGDSAREI
jgi:hypothetical protein